jgi:calcium-translocating P-type ATPase
MGNSLHGLSESQALASREKYGENILTRKKRNSFFTSFLGSFGDPMIKILLIALAVNIIFLHSNWFESVGIAVAILLATFVSTLSEYGSETAFEKLQEEALRINARVRRARGVTEIPVGDIVVGDIVLLQAGERVPADGVMEDGKLEVDQSLLNGETKEALKFPSNSSVVSSTKKNSSQDSSSKTDFLNPSAMFSGSVVCSGEGVMRVTAVGDGTVYGKIGSELQEETRESPLKIRLGGLAETIGKFSYFAAVFTALAYFFNVICLDNNFQKDLMLETLTNGKEMFTHFTKAASFAVTVIVMAVPEGLPMMITVVLSANMKRMLKDHVLVRKLTGIETAGSMNILFTDKTGTITEGKLNVSSFISGSGEKVSTESIARDKNYAELADILHTAIYYNTAAEQGETKTIGGNATDRALFDFAVKLPIRKKSLQKLSAIPFTSEKKFMATQIGGSFNGTLIKGAPERILPYCTTKYDKFGTLKHGIDRVAMNNLVKELASDAVRVIAIAISDNAVSESGNFSNLKLVGLVGIRDRIRKEASEGVRTVQNAGIQTVMITGDSALTAEAVAKESGILRKKSDIILTSDELSKMSDEQVTAILPNLRVVARALPSDKSRLVRIAQAKGLVTGMTGDGVNDAPALKTADIGFAMGSGTEIAKEAGDIVILDDNIGSVAKAVCYGRTIFKSIRKFVIYQMSICMCAVGVTVAGPLLGVDLPITVIQMLWINIVMDTLAGLAFSGETARKKYMEEPPKSRTEPILNGYMTGQIAIGSVYTAGLCLFFLKSEKIQNALSAYGDIYAMTAFFALFMFMAIFTSFCARTHKLNLLDYLASNKAFILIMGAVTLIQILILYYGGTVFRTGGLEPRHLLLTAGLAFTVIPVDIIRKLVLTKKVGYSGT